MVIGELSGLGSSGAGLSDGLVIWRSRGLWVSVRAVGARALTAVLSAVNQAARAVEGESRQKFFTQDVNGILLE